MSYRFTRGVDHSKLLVNERKNVFYTFEKTILAKDETCWPNITINIVSCYPAYDLNCRKNCWWFSYSGVNKMYSLKQSSKSMKKLGLESDVLFKFI